MLISIILLFFTPLNLLVHEMGHIIYYIKNKVNIYAFVYFNRVFVKKDKKWTMYKIKNSHSSFVVPEINSRYSLNTCENIIINDLLIGPLVSFFLFVMFGICLIIYCKSNETDTLVKLLLISNISINLSILSSCIHSNDKCVGDILFYNQCKKDKSKVRVYVLDYILYNGGIHIDKCWIDKVDFNNLDEWEKVDWAFDIVSLYLLGNIERVSEEIHLYVIHYLEYCNVVDAMDRVIKIRFQEYLNYIESKSVKAKVLGNDIYQESPILKIYEKEEIEKKINERFGVVDGQSIRS